MRPQLGENIGAVARAMSNFGLKELRLVAPRDGWPNKRANETASGGESIVEAAKVYKDTASALKGIQTAYATTARSRDMEKKVSDPAAAAKEMAKGGGKVALMFGPERTGLENDDIALADAFITIPTDEGHWSLNLAQSVVILGYEWFKISGAKSPARKAPDVAPKEDWKGLFDQLEGYLDETNFFRVPHKKDIMWQNMRNMLLRGKFSAQEIRTFRGMLRVLNEGRKPRMQKRNSPREL